MTQETQKTSKAVAIVSIIVIVLILSVGAYYVWESQQAKTWANQMFDKGCIPTGPSTWTGTPTSFRCPK